MATTSPDNIWTPDSGDDYALTTDLAAMADTVQDAITDVRGEITTSSLAQAGLFSARPTFGVEGRTYYATDQDRSYFDTGSAWVSNDPGLHLIRPTSALGGAATLQSDGSITWTGNAANTFVGANGVFSTRFRFYKIFFEYASASSAAWSMRLASAGSLLTAASYSYNSSFINAATSGGNNASGQTSALFTAITTTGTYGEVTVRNPADPATTTFLHYQGTGGVLPVIGGALYNVATAADGFTFASAGASGSGYMKVYGIV